MRAYLFFGFLHEGVFEVGRGVIQGWGLFELGVFEVGEGVIQGGEGYSRWVGYSMWGRGLFEGGRKYFTVFGDVPCEIFMPMNYFLMLQIKAIECFSKDA